MNLTERKNLKQQVEVKYQQAIKKATDERDKAIASIDHVWDLTHPKPDSTSDASNKTSSISPYGSLVETARKALMLVPQDRFTRLDVAKAMKGISPDIANECKASSIAGCLMRFCTERIIKVIEKGKGRIPAKYKIIIDTTENPSMEKG